MPGWLHEAAGGAGLAALAALGLYLAALGLVALTRPARVRGFLLGFAATPGRHLLELALRTAAGLACLLAAPRLPAAQGFTVAGWVLLASTAVLALLPWRWHRGFAQRAVPRALRALPALGLAALAAGLALLAAVVAALRAALGAPGPGG